MEKIFCDAVDPVFQGAFHFLRKIDAGQIVALADVRSNLKQLIEQGERIAGSRPEWDLIKYALCCWIDEIFTYSSWADKDLWKEKYLEKEFFGESIAYHEFFQKAKQASASAQTNALEVYYLCVVLGFRGPYRGSDQPQKIAELERLQLPRDPADWFREVSRSLKARHTLPPISEAVTPLRGNEMHEGRQQLLTSSILAALLMALAVGGWFFVWKKFYPPASADSQKVSKVWKQSVDDLRANGRS